ncbi:MAG: hypothetical protein LPK02_06940 [Rhodobacterales bacterium]|nr:hypothetical protein [Rhodobacterales bacterium]
MPKTKLNRNLHVQPSDPYDTDAWMEFYAANPGFRRSVGAEGVNDDDEAAKAAEAEAAKKAEEDAAAKAAEDDGKPKPSDREAELLKDVMKQKEANKALKAQLDQISKQIEGVDLEEYRQIKAQQAEAAEAAKKAEEDRLIKEGEFEKVKEQMLSQHNQALDAVKSQLTAKDEELAKAHKIIEELTIGSGFSASKFIAEATVFTPTKARRLYGDHFEVEDGKVVAYDKPRGVDGRTRLVDAAGNPVDFDAAMKRIIEADPEKDDILVADIKPGSNSNPSRGQEEVKSSPKSARDKISNGIQDLMKTIDTPSPSGIKL